MHRVPLHPRTALCALLALLGCAATTACGTPPELEPTRGAPLPGAAASSGGASPSITASPTWPYPAATPPTSPSGFPDAYAVSCAGKPSGNQVIGLVRGTRGLLPSGVTVTVRTGPLCARDWQYTVLAVSGHEPLAVVTRGPATALRLVTAGTDVCSIPVRVEAPPGIRSAATCA